MHYIHLSLGGSLPKLEISSPFLAVVVAEETVSVNWQSVVSDWIVNSGCLYMMAWGKNCSSWDDSVDMANIILFLDEKTPDDKFVMTSWHDNEPLEQVFWFAKNCAHHPTVELKETLIIHISKINKEQLLISKYQNA